MLVEIALLASLCYLIWQAVQRKYAHFSDKGVPCASYWPLIGSLKQNILRREHLFDSLQSIYDDVGDSRCKFVGFYNTYVPTLLIKDPEMIKQITVKDFEFFTDHQNGIDENVEPVFGKSLFSLKGQKWKDMRSALSPAFTSSKIRDMCHLVSECGDQMTAYLNNLCAQNDNKSIDIEGKDLGGRFMIDVIATTAFGIKVDSFNDKDNEFHKMGISITNFGGMTFLKMIFGFMFPKLARMLEIRVFDPKLTSFFKDLVLNGIKYRQENNIVRRDMLQLLMEAKQGSLKYEIASHAEKDAGFATVQESEIGRRESKRVWEDDDLVAQAMLFFFAGFETASTLAAFLVHELAVNPDIHDKLQSEIDDAVQQNGYAVNYDMIQRMKYLDMVVSEELRKWPAGGFGDRRCTNDIDLGPVRDGDRVSYTVSDIQAEWAMKFGPYIRKGESIWLPTLSIHRDPKFWPNPLKFDPERFSDENKHNIQPFTYIPFGAGPRNCIGSRLALMNAKVFIFHIIAKFNIEVSSKTSKSIKLDKKTFMLCSEDGFWVKLRARSGNFN